MASLRTLARSQKRTLFTRHSLSLALTVLAVGLVATSLEPGGCANAQNRNGSALRPVAAPSGSRHGEADGPSTTAQHPLVPAMELAHESLQHLRETVRDYTATIVKRERIGGELTDHQILDAKIRNRQIEGQKTITPLSVYLSFRKPKAVSGREVIWVEGRNGGNLLVHEGGFKNLLRLQLKPDNMLAMLGQRYPITDIGIENLLLKLIEKGEREMQYGECNVKIYQGAKVSERMCSMIQVEHPIRRDHFDFYRARIFIDDELQIPIRYAAWSWPETPDGEAVLEEEYTYLRLRTNVGLTDADFDPDNSNYNYP